MVWIVWLRGVKKMSFEAFIRNHYEVRDTGRKDMIRINCPFCADDKFHGYVNVERNLFKCWKCRWSHKPMGEATTAYYFLKEAHGISSGEILNILKADYSVLESYGLKPLLESLEDFFDGREGFFAEHQFAEPQIMHLPKDSHPISPHGISLLNKMAWKYLEQRFHNPFDIYRKYNLHYCSSGQYFGHIIIPVYEWGELVWYQGRVFFPRNKDPKYMSPSSTTKPVFNIDTKEKDVILVEGVFDAMTLGDSALCPFGSSLSRRQLSMIREREFDSITIYFDNDYSGINGAIQAAKNFQSYTKQVMMVYGLEEDPNSLGKRAWEEIQKHLLYWNTETEVKMRTNELPKL